MAKQKKTEYEKTEAPAEVVDFTTLVANSYDTKEDTLLPMVEEVVVEVDFESDFYTAAKTEEAVKIVESGFIPLDDFDRILALSSTRNTGGKRGNGVVPKKYYDIYKAQGGSNGDVFSVAMREAFTVTDQWGNEHIDVVTLTSWAKANGFWKTIYEGKNPGMVRMNVGNLARGVIRRGGSVVLNGVEYGKGDIKPVK